MQYLRYSCEVWKNSISVIDIGYYGVLSYQRSYEAGLII